jgi:2-polyprenyl-6-methoxyphenol hydroxylase-like FAD-dependent oxidoreductase
VASEAAFVSGQERVDEHVPVLIVGGSMVGLSMAAFLAFHGVRSLAIERHGGTAIHPRAAHFHLRTLEVFRAMGLEEDVRRKSEEQYDSDGGISAVESLAGKEIAKYIPSLNAGVEAVSPSRRLFLTQEALEPILREHALRLGAELRYSTELTDFEQSGDGVLATTRELEGGAERRIRADYLVACDGWRSPVRERLGIAMDGHGLISNSITIYFRADVGEYVAGRTEGVFYVFNDVLRGFFRLDRSCQSGFLVVNTVGDTSRPEATNVAESITRDRAAELLRAAIGVPDIPVDVVDIAPWKAIADVAESFGRGRVRIAGDAAHTMPPNGGFGGNTGVQDAFNLAWKVAHVIGGKAGPELVDTYDAERQPVGRLTIEQAYTRYVLRTAPYLGTDHIQPIVDDLSLEIGHRYRSAAVLADPAVSEDDGLPYVDPRESRGLPGTRAPHLWVQDGMSTLDLFRRRMTLLTPTSAWEDAARAAGVEVDVHRIEHPDFPEAYETGESGAVLVRPDGYVAWRSRETASAEAIEAALDSLLSLGSRVSTGRGKRVS